MKNAQDYNANKETIATNTVSNTADTDSIKDYISGDSTPSSSAHQFPWIATNPKKESKKSAMKTNSTKH